MKRFVEGSDREQSTLFPECVADWIGEDNPVRVIDVFVDELDLAELGFDGVKPEVTGRPSYHPSVLLKLYIYQRGRPGRRPCADGSRNPTNAVKMRTLDHGRLLGFGFANPNQAPWSGAGVLLRRGDCPEHGPMAAQRAIGQLQ